MDEEGEKLLNDIIEKAKDTLEDMERLINRYTTGVYDSDTPETSVDGDVITIHKRELCNGGYAESFWYVLRELLQDGVEAVDKNENKYEIVSEDYGTTKSIYFKAEGDLFEKGDAVVKRIEIGFDYNKKAKEIIPFFGLYAEAKKKENELYSVDGYVEGYSEVYDADYGYDKLLIVNWWNRTLRIKKKRGEFTGKEIERILRGIEWEASLDADRVLGDISREIEELRTDPKIQEIVITNEYEDGYTFPRNFDEAAKFISDLIDQVEDTNGAGREFAKKLKIFQIWSKTEKL